MAVPCDQRGHASAMRTVLLTVRTTTLEEILTGQHIACEVGVGPVDARVDDGDGHPPTCGYLLNRIRIER